MFSEGVHDVSVFRIGFANDEIRAQALVANCCDVVLVGKEQSMEPVLEMVRALIEQRDNANAPQSIARAKKWNFYYEASDQPPWEADVPFQGLVEYLAQDMSSNDVTTRPPLNIIELGCGSSATAIWLAEQGHHVTAVDISLPGLQRAQSHSNAHLVNWILADILDPSLFTTSHTKISSFTTPSSSSSSSLTTTEENKQLRLNRDSYDIVFDMQCFHVLRESSLEEEEQAVHIITDLLESGDFFFF